MMVHDETEAGQIHEVIPGGSRTAVAVPRGTGLDW